MDAPQPSPTEKPVAQSLQAWYASFLGQQLASAERKVLDILLPDLFGYHLIQLGNHGNADLCAGSRVSNCVVISTNMQELAGLYADGERLPLASESVDVFVLPHTLEFHPNPHALLREVDRVLIPEGHIVILSFNPWSLWGVFRLLLAWRKQMPWRGHYFSRPRLRDWLSLLGFDYMCGRQVFFKPPLQHDKVMEKLEFMEKFGRRLWPVFAGVFVLVARKRTSTLTPIGPRWRRTNKIVNGGLVEPSTRGMQYDESR